MKRLSLAALLTFAAAFSPAAVAAEAKVVPFVKKGVDPLIVLNITSLVASELDFMGEYDDVEQLDDYPSGYSLSCLSKTSCMGTVGKALGTDFVLGGSVASAGSQFDVYMVLFDVNRGTFVRKKTFKVDKAPEKMADSMGAYVQELVTGKSRAQVVEEASVASVDEFAMDEEDDFDDLEFDFDDGDSSARVSTPGNSSNTLDDFEEAEDPAYEARRAEEERRAEEQRRREEAARRAEDERRLEEQRRREEEQRRAEEQRQAEEERRAEEQRRREAEEKRQADEERKRAKEEEKRRKEQERADAERAERERQDAAERAERERQDAARRQAEEDAVVDEYDYDNDAGDDFDEISFGSSVSVDEIEFGSSVTAEESTYDDYEETSNDRYETLDETDDFDGGYDDSPRTASSDDGHFSDDYYDDLDSYEPSEREVAEARGSDSRDRYDDDRYEDDRRSSSSSASSASRNEGRSGSTATISGTYQPHDPRVGITARAGYSRYQAWNFVSYGAEVAIPVSDTIFVQIGLAGYSVNRDVPTELQAEIGSEKIWNTIVPFNLGFIYQGSKSNIRPYGGLDITLTPYTRTFKVALGARARVGVDFMIVETFGINVNTGLVVWYGSDFDLIEEGVSEFGFIPSINAGTVLKF